MSETILQRNLVRNIKALIENAKKQVVRNVNTTMLLTYFEVGKMIVEYDQKGQRRAEYAKKTLKTLSKTLTNEFGKGYSVDNLQWMRKFFITYSKSQMLPRVSSETSLTQKYETPFRKSPFSLELTWSHYVQLLKIENDEERHFYEIESIDNK